ncbi:hypothetical protein P691DRAFT_808531 [Macrolepiota fuliginosa MF-IS2]|uniref:F-box domain-containing protein n=1 Tax=Macrolepiota fuliginosa MF-IS2 TaxID=1400762 RepID=A0A9P5XS58_9AGAR|nr:hypothetical protein P691DRAFT_808531 [Macrolepiota fuliginosa MF-IS2]
MASTLPLDILPIILSHLAIPDIFRFRLVCRNYLHITKTHALWFSYLQQHFLRYSRPLPGLNGRSLDALGAKELEHLAIRAEKYRRNWRSKEPKPTRHVEFIAVPESRIVSLDFLSRNGENWLLSLAMTRNNGLRAFTFQCWDLSTNPPTCIARRILHHFAGMAFNRLSTGRAVVAVKTPECVGFFPSCCLGALTCRGVLLRICLIDIDPTLPSGGGNPSLARSPPQACVNIASLEDRAVGNLILVGDLMLTQDDVGRAFLYHFERPEARVELAFPEGNVQPERILDVLVDRDWIILARTTTVELYPLPASIDRNIQIESIATHKWQWKVDSMSIVCPTDNSLSPVKPVHMTLRYGSIHPWPVNLIHRYVLNPNDFFDSTKPASRENLPYLFPPFNTQMIGSPIRLMATYDMTVGSHGTIVYIDSHTESYFRHSDFGQRLVGTHMDEQAEDGTTVGETSVYTVNERDQWTRIALQEEEGRIAIGHVDGRITVFDYA